MMIAESLGNVPPTAVLAPLSGVTDVAFRRLASRFGASHVVTEMVAADAYVRQEEEARLRSAGEGLSRHVVQLVGRDPARMGEAARLAEASGADVVDLNMGCPAKKVVGGLGGSALMREPGLALALVEAAVAAVRVPVTVKMRLGWDEASLNAPDLATRFAAAGAAGITVHGRTRRQFYEGRADWTAIGATVRAAGVPVTANGDVASLADARACLAASGATTVMIGRAAIGRPWLVGQVAAGLAGRPWSPPAPDVRTAAAIEHYEALLALYGPKMAVRHARKHLAAYADEAAAEGYGLPAAERALLVTATEPAVVLRLLGRLRAEPLARAAA